MQNFNDNKFLNVRDFGALGSCFETTSETFMGSDVFDCFDIGDFQVGNEIVAFGCDAHVEQAILFEKRDVSPVNPRPWKHNQPVEGRVEIRGYEGKNAARIVYFIDFHPENREVFNWSNDFGKTWQKNIKITGEWTLLHDHVEVKINEFKEREYGCTAVFVCTDRMVAEILEINGNKVRLSKKANKTGKCSLVHSDTAAIQKTIDEALRLNKNVFIPNGRYRISKSLRIENAKSFTIEGESSELTIIDNSLGHCGVERAEGSCFVLEGGDEINIRNLRMEGCLGYCERDMVRWMKECGGTSVWGFYFMKSNASCIHSTKRVLFENCHARKMSAECFYAEGNRRDGIDETEQYNREVTYLRCSVEDSARNAFNDNDFSEGTSLINCRIRDIGGCAWEGASRFVKINGCYMRNCGSIALGNVRGRRGCFDGLGTGQHIITNNYFESGIPYGPAMITIGSYASQVTISNNTFVNFNSNAVYVMGETQAVDTPPENVIITGNSFDMTAVDSESKPRCAVKISSDYVTVSDNQIYARGECDRNLTGIYITDDVVRLVVHDNSLSGCGYGIISQKASGAVGNVVSEREFYRFDPAIPDTGVKPSLVRTTSHRYRSWKLVWFADESESTILEFDPHTTLFTLEEGRTMKAGDEFYIYSPNSLPWSIHHNIVDNSNVPISLDTYSGKRARLDGNIF